MEQKTKDSSLFMKTPKSLVEIPKFAAKWKISPEYKISDKIPTENARNILIGET